MMQLFHQSNVPVMDQQSSKPTKNTPRKSMHTKIVQELGMQIVSGRFKPEERLPMEATLCEEYQVSRSVLREATRVLSAKGLVYSKPRVGAVVRPRLKWHLLDPDVLAWLMQSTPHSEFFNTLAGVRRILEPEWPPPRRPTKTLRASKKPIRPWNRRRPTRSSCRRTWTFTGRLPTPPATICSPICATCCHCRCANPLPRHKAILTAIQNRDALGARHASLVQLDDTRVALDTVMNILTPL